MAVTTQLDELKINYLTEDQYAEALAAGNIKDDEIYMTPASPAPTIADNITPGLVKSGTDISVDEQGNVSVKNDSHSHSSLSISGGNEVNLVNGFSKQDGNIYINYKGATAPIKNYNFRDGMGGSKVNVLADQFSENGVYLNQKYAPIVHTHTKSEVGLENVDNTSDATKSVKSAATLTTARKIAKTTFDGSKDIDIDYNNLTNKPSIYTQTQANSKFVHQDTQPFVSGRDFKSGTLIKTNIDYGENITNTFPWYMTITGNGYDAQHSPVLTILQGYVYTGKLLYHLKGLNIGLSIPVIHAFSLDNKLCFWFERLGYWQGFDVTIKNKLNQNVSQENHVISITDSDLPANIWGSYEIVVSDTYHTNRKPTKTDVGLDQVDNTADTDKNVNSATKLKDSHDNSDITISYSNSDINNFTYIAVWNGHELRTVGHAGFKKRLGLDLVENTADINKNVNSAKTLATPRKINGVPFDGSQDISINATTDPIVLSDEDLDSLHGEAYIGDYYSQGSNTVKHKPDGIDAFGLSIKRIAAGYYCQELIGANQSDGRVFRRVYTGSSWTNWQANYTTQYKQDIPSYTLSEITATTGYSTSYQLKKDGVAIGAKINIPKDMVVQSGSIKTVATAGSPYTGAKVGDKYLDLVIANASSSHVYIPVKDLVDVYTAGTSISISDSNQISVVTDTSLSSTSIHPIQNKVVKGALDKKLDLTGGTLTGNLNMNQSNIVMSNNYSVMGKDSSGTNTPMLIINPQNEIAVGSRDKQIRLNCANPIQKDGHKLYHEGFKPANTTYTLDGSISSKNGATKVILTGSDSTTDSVTIKGAGATSVTTDASGNISVTSTDTKYGIANSTTAGLVKSGTDITVDASGNVSVKDDSHTHSKLNIGFTNEINIANGYDSTGGGVHINYRGATKPINNYYLDNGMQGNAEANLYLKELNENGEWLKNKYAVKSHSHAISDVTNLQSKLDAKLGAKSNGSYWGMTAPDNNESNWIRTTESGIIPFKSGGASGLGSTAWPFNFVYAKTMYEDGTALSSKYAAKSHTHSISDVTGLSTGFAKRVRLTGQCQVGSYKRSVIALCELAGDKAHMDSYSVGTLTFHRTNGLNQPVKTDIAIENRYSGDYVVNASLESTAYGIKACTFMYKGKHYGGVEFFFGDAELSIIDFYGSTNFDIFALDYYNTNTKTAIDQEINDSLSFDTVYYKEEHNINTFPILTSKNHTKYTPTLTGTGATGDWNITSNKTKMIIDTDDAKDITISFHKPDSTDFGYFAVWNSRELRSTNATEMKKKLLLNNVDNTADSSKNVDKVDGWDIEYQTGYTSNSPTFICGFDTNKNKIKCAQNGIVKGYLKATTFYENGELLSDKYSLSGHTHDDRYYTESEVDTKLNTKLNLLGGTMTGPVHFKDGAALPNHSSLQFICGITAFDAGGTLGWTSSSNVSVGSASHIKDAANDTNIAVQFSGNYQKPKYFASWTGDYKIGCSSLDQMRTALSINNVDNTSDSQKSVKYAATAGSMGEANLSWGGKNIVAGFSPVDAAMIPELGANRLAYIKPEGIDIEYSRDGGQTWIDYGAANGEKVNLFVNSQTFTIGKSTSTNKATGECLLRVTLKSPEIGLYTALRKFAILCSTSGSTDCYCTIEAISKDTERVTPSAFTTVVDKQKISGWSGWNVINTGNLTTWSGSSDQTSQLSKIRFIFGCASHNSKYTGLSVNTIMGFGGVGWSTPSNMAKTGHIYSYDYNQNAHFPASIKVHNYINASRIHLTSQSPGIDFVGAAGSAIHYSDGFVFGGYGENTKTKLRSNGDNLYHLVYPGNSMYKILDENNYTSYAPTKTGTGASGTWGINVTGYSKSMFTNDTRSVNNTPAQLPSQSFMTEFKQGSNIDLTTTGTYCALQSIKAWSNYSGGNAYQLAYHYNDSKPTVPYMSIRTGGIDTSTWSPWYNIYHEGYKPTKADVGLSNVENKSSAAIRGEITSSNVTTALGYTPPRVNTTYGAATKDTLGLIKVGKGLSITEGTLKTDIGLEWETRSNSTPGEQFYALQNNLPGNQEILRMPGGAILPYSSSSYETGRTSLGLPSWAFSAAYVDKINTNSILPKVTSTNYWDGHGTIGDLTHWYKNLFVQQGQISNLSMQNGGAIGLGDSYGSWNQVGYNKWIGSIIHPYQGLINGSDGAHSILRIHTNTTNNVVCLYKHNDVVGFVGYKHALTQPGGNDGNGYSWDTRWDTNNGDFYHSGRLIVETLKSASGSNGYYVQCDGNGTLSRRPSSSRRYKHDITQLQGDLDYKHILDIPVVQYAYNEDYIAPIEEGGHNPLVPGLIAEEVYANYPIATVIMDNQIEDWDERYIIPPMLAVEQDHEQRIAMLEKENEQLRQELLKLQNNTSK